MDQPRHNMFVVGEKSVFLSHLPMFMLPHNRQFILEATFTNRGNVVDDIYFKDRHSHPDTKLYTFEPEVLELEGLLKTGSDASIRSFQGTVFRGHLERGGRKIESLANIQVNVKNVVYSQQFGPDLVKSEKLEYLLFGNKQELFLAHVITAPPDFDQILSVEIDNPPIDEELTRGVRVVIPGRSNSASQRIKEKESVPGQGHVTGAHQFLKFQIQAGVEVYLEEGELSAQM